MPTSDDNVSPYLRRPIRSYEQFLWERAMKTRAANRRTDPPVGPSTRYPPKRNEDHVEPCS